MLLLPGFTVGFGSGMETVGIRGIQPTHRSAMKVGHGVAGSHGSAGFMRRYQGFLTFQYGGSQLNELIEGQHNQEIVVEGVS